LVSFRQTIRSLDHITRTLSDHFSIQPIWFQWLKIRKR
jgi:hypothetical protein